MNTNKCDSCGGEMKLDKKGKYVKKRKNGSVRIRRFICGVCDIVKTVYGTGDGDIVRADSSTDVKRMNKLNEDHNKNFI
jgi:hypothetical protein